MQKSKKTKSLPTNEQDAPRVSETGDQDQAVKIRVTDKRFWVQDGEGYAGKGVLRIAQAHLRGGAGDEEG